MSYVIAAYGLVVVTLAWYAWRVQSQRRRLGRQAEPPASGERGA